MTQKSDLQNSLGATNIGNETHRTKIAFLIDKTYSNLITYTKNFNENQRFFTEVIRF